MAEPSKRANVRMYARKARHAYSFSFTAFLFVLLSPLMALVQSPRLGGFVHARGRVSLGSCGDRNFVTSIYWVCLNREYAY